MNQQQIIFKTAAYVKRTLDTDGSHDWWHIERVWQMARRIGKKEKADLFIVELGALLHDIADWKFNNGNLKIGGTVASNWLSKLSVDEAIIKKVSYIVENVSFKGSQVRDKIKTVEGKVVQDADRLDAIGAIGVARVFAYAGYRGNPIYEPDVKPTLHKNFKQYKNARSSAVNHMYEKLLLLKDRMNTATGRKLAIGRHDYMLRYLNQFYKEWKGIS